LPLFRECDIRHLSTGGLFTLMNQEISKKLKRPVVVKRRRKPEEVAPSGSMSAIKLNEKRKTVAAYYQSHLIWEK
jgi:hypothetical protein